MFTGIVLSTGKVVAREARGGDLRLQIDATAFDAGDIALGDSICVSGVCLTVAGRGGGVLGFDVSKETLSLTTLGALRAGDAVNLEPALRLSDRIGGHLVSGHVDGIGRIVVVEPDARSQRWTIEAPATLSRYIAAKGSICIDGVSLTVNEVEGNRCSVNLIPHTIEATTFRERRAGDAVNVEVDMMARYAGRLLQSDVD